MSDERSQPFIRKPRLRKPESTDGPAIWELVRDCKPLDENSMYCNLVQADHFRDTCVVAELDGEIVGWISGHMIPGADTFFVWQVAVGEKARGCGLGRKMLAHLIAREECADALSLGDDDHRGQRRVLGPVPELRALDRREALGPPALPERRPFRRPSRHRASGVDFAAAGRSA